MIDSEAPETIIVRREQLPFVLSALADEIDAALDRHHKAFPDGAWRDTNETLGALNRLAMEYLHQNDWHKGNEQTALLLRKHALWEAKAIKKMRAKLEEMEPNT